MVLGAIAVASLVAAVTAGAGATRTMLVGRSVDGREITVRVIGPAGARRRVLVVGCIHGDECAGRRIVDALAHRRPPPGVQLWLIDELNPDGSVAGTRQNAHGVDLNRNFPYRWQASSDPTYDSGPRPLSEPESRAAASLIRRVRPDVTIWYHQHEDLIDMAGGDRGIARRYANTAGMRATCLPFLPGTATSWSNHALAGTTAFVVELPGGPVAPTALGRHLRAVAGAERGARIGSRSSCRR